MRLSDPLIVNLDKAIAVLSEFRGGYSGDYLSAEEFHVDLSKAVETLKKGDLTVVTKLCWWFAPTCQWDDFTGKEGIELGNVIFSQLRMLLEQLGLKT